MAPLSVLMLAAEAEPFAKTGGLAEVTAGLSRALAARGVGVRLALPLSRMVGERGFSPRPTGVEMEFAAGRETIRMRAALLEREGVEALFLDAPALFDREGLYGTREGDFPDNPLRFSLFVRGVLEAASRLGPPPDLIHAHDWHTALAPLYLRHRLAPPALGRVPTLLTVHNLAYQGVFDRSAFPLLGLPPQAFGMEELEYYGRVNFLKGGMGAATAVSTVSPSYAREILTPEGGWGLEGILRHRGDEVPGILNGLDTEVWDPAGDPALPQRYGPSDPGGKARNRSALEGELGLSGPPGAPLFAFVGRLAGQKGIDLLAAVLPWLTGEGALVAVQGVGEDRYHRMVQEAVSACPPGRAVAALCFDEGLAHRLYAGSDFFLMPSQYEPCGLGQMIALRYGSVPVARRTGGIGDTVEEFGRDTARGTGFLFEEFTPRAFQGALERALSAFRAGSLGAAVARGMSLDFSWDRSAGEYVELYERLARGT